MHLLDPKSVAIFENGPLRQKLSQHLLSRVFFAGNGSSDGGHCFDYITKFTRPQSSHTDRSKVAIVAIQLPVKPMHGGNTHAPIKLPCIPSDKESAVFALPQFKCRTRRLTRQLLSRSPVFKYRD